MSLYNVDELVAPAWITQQFLENVLSTYEHKGNVEIIKLDVKPACMKGDHYASVMFRCKLHYRFARNVSVTKHRSLIIKTLPIEDGAKRDMLLQSKLFETEIEMYMEALPKIEKILAECGEPTRLSPGIIYHSLEPHKVVILEDLCESGYETMRGRFPTEDEIKAIYTKLAKLHAVSYMLGHSTEPELVTKYREGFMNISAPVMKGLMTTNIRNFIKMLSSYEEFAIYAEKMKIMQDEIEPACKDLFRAFNLNNDHGDIFVLNHGDFHLKNLMFKFNTENQVEDMIMVDFQLSCYAPSTIDLTYSQFLMLSPHLRLRRHELMQYYFTEFTKMLKKLHYKGELPKYSEFQIAGLKYRHFVIYLLAVLLPMFVGIFSKSPEELKDVDATKLAEDPNLSASNFYLPAFVEEVRKLMPILLREGYFD